MAQQRFGIIDKELVNTANEKALALIRATFAEARNRPEEVSTDGKPALFPNGIDMIHVKFEISVSEAAKLAIDVELQGVKKP